MCIHTHAYAYVFFIFAFARQVKAVQCEFPKLEVKLGRVMFRFDTFMRRLQVPRDATTLREACVKLAPLVQTFEDETNSLVSLNRTAMT